MREIRNADPVPGVGASRPGLSGSLHAFLGVVLMYKSAFLGDSLLHLAALEGAQARDALGRILEETASSARCVLDLAREWDCHPVGDEALLAAEAVRARMMEDLRHLKDRSTEALLVAALHAPTEDLRREFIALADIDRRHSDALREVMGIQARAALSRPEEPEDATQCSGVREGPFEPGNLGRSVDRLLAVLRARGRTPARLVVSDVTLRHLRDEGVVEAETGTIHGIAVDVDFGWDGEAFAVLTRDGVSLVEIVAAQRAGRARTG